MRVTCSRENLHRALTAAGRAVATKSTLPVLGTYLLEADGDHLLITATNLEISIAVQIDATVEKPGKAAVQARVLHDFVSSLPPGDVKLSDDEDPLNLTVSQNLSEAKVRGSDADDFPPISRTMRDGATIHMEPETLRDAISHVVFAAASDDSRPVLAGVQLRTGGDDVHFAAADGFRMSLHRVALSEPAAQPISIIVPARSLNELSRLLGDGEKVDLTVSPNQSQLLVSMGDMWFTTRLIDGAFPDLTNIIPTDWNTRTTVQREVLLDAAKRAAIFSRSANDIVRFEIEPASADLDMGRVTITGTAADTGSNRDEVDAQVEGNEVQISFSGRYLTDVLSIMRESNVLLEFKGGSSAGVIRPADSEAFTHVIMPMVGGAN